MNMPRASFWRGKRVLLTGHSGFKGSWLAIWLHQLGAQVIGISLPPDTEPNLYQLASIDNLCESHFADIRNGPALASLIKAAEPDIIFHLAAQSLVRASYREALLTFDTNVMGTAHVLDAMRGLVGLKVAVMITTDKVYRNIDQRKPFSEEDMLGGHDPYSASKAASELVIESYRSAFLAEQSVSVASARAGNVIGGGDWSEDRLIPDAVRAWQAEEVLEVRRPESVRPWQHVLDPLSGYLALAERLWDNPADAGAYNFGPETDAAASVNEVIELACANFGSGRVNYADDNAGPHEAGVLILEAEKAKNILGVEPRWSLGQAVNRTMQWYRAQLGGANAKALCLADIAEFEASV